MFLQSHQSQAGDTAKKKENSTNQNHQHSQEIASNSAAQLKYEASETMAQLKPEDELQKKPEDELQKKEDSSIQMQEEEELQTKPEEELQKKEDDELQKKPEDELQKKDDEELQKKSEQNSANSNTQNLNKSSSPEKMPADVQSKMEGSFGTDFSGVNIHRNDESATQLKAQAYAQGNNLHFAPGKYTPESTRGQELLGHELAHVVQQREGKVKPTKQGKGMPVNDSVSLEHEADVKGKKASEGKKA